MSARIEIEDRLAENLARVRHLIELYEQLAGPGGGRRGVKDSDVLRASVVLLHAALEDLLRTTLAWKWPASQNPEHLEELTFMFGSSRSPVRKQKASIADLVAHRHRQVDELIRDAISGHLAASNYNNVRDMMRALEYSGLDSKLVVPQASKLAALMRRRHWIVHRADQNAATGQGHHLAMSLSAKLVRNWVGSVERFGQSILASV